MTIATTMSSISRRAQQNYATRAPYYYGGYPRYAAFNFDHSSDKSFVEELRLVSEDGRRLGLHRRWLLSGPEVAPHRPGDAARISAWTHLPGSADAYNYYAGTAFNTFADVIADRNAPTGGVVAD